MLARNGFGSEARNSARGASPNADFNGARGFWSFAAKSVASLRFRTDGQALVEFAFALPVLLLLLTGIYTFGIAYTNKISLTQGVGQAAQVLQVSRSTSTDPCATAWNALVAAAPTLKSSQITMSISFNGATPVVGSTCTGSVTAFGQTQGLTNTVYASYPCNLLIFQHVSSSCTISAQIAAYEY